MCYAGLKLADYNISKEECVIKGSSLDEVYKAIIMSGYTLPECLYIKGLVEALIWDELVELAKDFQRKWALDKDYELLSKLDLSQAFVSRVSSMYRTGMGGILLRELTHFYKGHFDRMPFESRKELEKEADDMAFNAILKAPLQDRKSGILGFLSAYLLAFYVNPNLTPNDNYYREDERLFSQFDKIQDTDLKRRANVLVAYILNHWLKVSHQKEVIIVNHKEKEAVEEIRNILNVL